LSEELSEEESPPYSMGTRVFRDDSIPDTEDDLMVEEEDSYEEPSPEIHMVQTPRKVIPAVDPFAVRNVN
jgi:hypothetical protein